MSIFHQAAIKHPPPSLLNYVPPHPLVVPGACRTAPLWQGQHPAVVPRWHLHMAALAT